MAFDDKTLKRDGSGITPVPQHFNPTTNDYEPIYGRNNAGRVEIYGPDGNPISTDDSNKLAVRASEIETILNEIKSKDFATQTTLAAIFAKLIAAPATEAKQDTLISHVDGVEAALATLLTEARNDELFDMLFDVLGGASGTLNTISGKFGDVGGYISSQTGDLLGVLGDVAADPAANTILARLKTLSTLIGEAQVAPTANTLLARLKSLEDKIDAITDGTSPAVAQLSGSYVEIGGVSFAVSGGDTLRNTAANKPNADAAHAAIPFCYYHAIDTGVVEATDGTNWVVI